MSIPGFDLQARLIAAWLSHEPDFRFSDWEGRGLAFMCNRYLLSSGREEVARFARAVRDLAGWNETSLEIYPNTLAPIIRVGSDGARELVRATWGMPTPPAYIKGNYDPGITNIRNAMSPHWRRWLGVHNRCVVPVTAFAEPEGGKVAIGRRKGNAWFALSEDRPLMFFAGLWTPWRGVRKVRDGEQDFELFAFLTTEANDLVAAVHPKAMPVLLTSPLDVDRWLSEPWETAKTLQRPLPSSAMVRLDTANANRHQIRPAKSSSLIIACGALARELNALRRANRLDGFDVTYLPAQLHNRPERIAEAVRQAILNARPRYEHIFCAYGDCGSGGALDAVLQNENVERLPGPHCYSFFAGEDAFSEMMEEEVGTFFLTDFLARHFDRLVWRGLGLDRHPHLLGDYFGHYRRVVHLVQVPDARTAALASKAASMLNLPLVTRPTGLAAFALHLPGLPRTARHG